MVSPRKSRSARTRPGGFSGDDGVADADGAASDEHGGDHAAARVDLRLDDVAAGGRVRVCLQVRISGDEHEHVEKRVESQPLLGAGFDEDGVATPLLGHDLVLVSCCLMRSTLASGLSILLMTMTIGTLAAFGMVYGLDGLRHDAVVGSDHDGGDVGDFGAAGRAMAVKASWPGVSMNVIGLPS